MFWDLCEGRLEDGLDRALQVIEAACDDLDEDCGYPPDMFCLEIPDDPACRRRLTCVQARARARG